jgi:putative nucleotidyltransferase with HDIG domain
MSSMLFQGADQFPWIPHGGGPIDWPTIEGQFPWVSALKSCPQDPIYHAEGDVWTHTKLVCEALVSQSAWQSLPELDRATLFLAALFHDIAKPSVTAIDENGRISSKGHGRRGAKLARELLWRSHVPIAIREQVFHLIALGGLPLWFWDKPDPLRSMIEASQLVSCRAISILAEADVRGHLCQDQDQFLDRVVFFRDYCAEQDVLDRPWPFSSNHSRFIYAQNEQADPHYTAFDNTTFEVVLMSGLPGVGKDYWIEQHYADRPVVSLDRLRQAMDIAPDRPQGAVIQAAKEQAKTYLRREQPFVWNATNLSRQLREPLIQLFSNYGARINLIYLDASPEIQSQQNRSRSAQVPDAVIQRMMEKLDVPTCLEAQTVQWRTTNNE